MDQKIKHWKQARSPQDAFFLIDIGSIIAYKDLRWLRRVFSYEQEQEVVAYFAERFAERYRNRDAAEIILESLLLWLTFSAKEGLVVIFLQKIFEHPERIEIIQAFPRLCLNLELVEQPKSNDVFDVSVFLIAQMGLQIFSLAQLHPQEFSKSEDILPQISAIMISMSNVSSFRTRLCLFNYFGILELRHGKEHHYKKLMQRFGYTLVNEIFSDLFQKKNESFALAYLMDNLPHMMLASYNAQNVLQDVLRYNMLKYPNRFSLFLQAFNPCILTAVRDYPLGHQRTLTVNYVTHLAILLRVISQIDQPRLSKEILISLAAFKDHKQAQHLLQQLLSSQEIRVFYRELLEQLLGADNPRNYIERISKFRQKKRGPRPKIRHRNHGIFDQIYHLGRQQGPRQSHEAQQHAAA